MNIFILGKYFSCVQNIYIYIYLKLIRNCLIFLQMFKFKLKACNARIEWIKSPEDLQNCSIGFHFPLQSEGIAEVFNISAFIFI